MEKDSGKVIDHYSKMYRRLFRYGPIVSGLLVATVLSFFLLRGQAAVTPFADNQNATPPTIVDEPIVDNSGSRDNPTEPTPPTQEPWEGSIVYKTTNYNLDTLIKEIPLRTELGRKHTDNRTIISNSSIDVEDTTENFTATIDHSSGSDFSLIQINTDHDDINETINTLIVEQDLAVAKVFDVLHNALITKNQHTSSCTSIEQELASYGEIECDSGFIRVKIVNKQYQRSYFFHHEDFALTHIETSDPDETEALSDIINIDTNADTLAKVIDRILDKRLVSSSATDQEEPADEVSTTFELALGVTPTSISEKDGSFGVNFTVQGISFFGIYDNESTTINGLLFTDVTVAGKPLSVPTFSLNFADQEPTQSFATDPLDFLEAVKAGIKDAYNTPKA